jgi:hypothetical protein
MFFGQINVQSSGLGNARTDFYVYVLFRPWDGSPCYVGKGRGRRWLQHEGMADHYNKNLARIIAKAAGDIPKVKIRINLTSAQACEIERALIAAIGRKPHGPLVNLTDGGDGKEGYVTPEKTRQRIRSANTGKVASLKTRLKMSEASRGRPHSPAHNTAVSVALTGRQFGAEHRENLKTAFNRPNVKEQKRRSLKHYFANLTLEERSERAQKISLATRSAMQNPEIRAKISKARRAR